jgi:hypothetical protein
MRLNAFVWNRISQGYSRVVKDAPPHSQWQSWRRGHRDLKPLRYQTPSSSSSSSSSPIPELSKTPSEIIEERCRRNIDDSVAEALVAAAAAATTTSALGNAAAPPMRYAVANDDDDNICYEDVLSADLAGPLHFREWASPFLEQSREASQVASTSDTTYLRPRQVSFTLNAPEDMKLTVVRCTFSRVEDVNDDFSTHVASLTGFIMVLI